MIPTLPTPTRNSYKPENTSLKPARANEFFAVFTVRNLCFYLVIIL